MMASLRLRAGLGLTLAFVALALLSRVWTPEPPARMHIALRLRPPLAAGLLGTDAFGRDIASVLMAGAWTSLSVASLAVLLGAVLGGALGFVAAGARGWTEEVLLRGADVVFAFPALISALMLAALIGPGQGTAILAIGLFAVPVFLRLSRGTARQVWASDYCLAARAAGMGPAAITVRHVLPNIAGPLLVQVSLQLGLAILVEAGLSYLGLGVPPPASSWGRMLGEAQTYAGQAPWMAIAPGVTIATAVLGLNLLGDGLRDLFDPRAPDRRP